MTKSHWLCESIFYHFYMNTSQSAVAPYAGLLTAVTDSESGTGFTEAAYTNYQREAVTFGNLAAANGGRKIDNTSAVTFQQAGSGPTDVIAVGIFDASSNGNLLNTIFLHPTKEPIVAVLEDSSTDTFKHGGHSLANDDTVRIEAIPGSGGIPGNMSENTTYYVVNTATNTFQLSTSQGGAAVDANAAGECIVAPFAAVTINQNDTPEFAANALVIYED
jgi:hypothetical protein